MNRFFIAYFSAAITAIIVGFFCTLVGLKGNTFTIMYVSSFTSVFIVTFILYPTWDRNNTRKQIAKDKIRMERYKEELKKWKD